MKNFKLEEIELGFENDLYAKVTTFREKIDHPDESVKAKNKNLYEHFLYFIHIITLLSSLYRNIHKGNLKLAKVSSLIVPIKISIEKRGQIGERGSDHHH